MSAADSTENTSRFLKTKVKSTHIYSRYIRNYIRMLIVLFAYFNTNGLQGQEVLSRIEGKIVSENNAEPIAQVLIFLDPIQRVAESDEQGNFAFPDVDAGIYHLHTQRVGYYDLAPEQEITVGAGEQQVINLSLREFVFSWTDAITVTATRSEKTTLEIPYATDVISGEQYSGQAILNISEALNGLRGTFIKDYGSIGALKTISLRGSSAEQVLVLLDGQRINNSQTGQVDLSTLSLEGIERVEVLRGGSSAIYGADAVGGVVNLVTANTAKKSGVNASLNALIGSFGTESITAGLGFKRNWFAGSFGFNQMRSEGDFSYKDVNGQSVKRENNDVSARDIFADIRFDLGNTLIAKNLQVYYKHYTAEKGSPGSLKYASTQARQDESSQRLHAMLEGKLFNVLHHYQLKAFLHRDKYNYDDPGAWIPVHEKNQTVTAGTEIVIRSVLSRSNTLTYGTGARENELESNQLPVNHKRQVYHGFIQDEIGLDFSRSLLPLTLNIIPALRFDHYSDFGSNWSPKIGTVIFWGSEKHLALKINAGQSFRAPTFNELYWPEDMWVKGNAQLNPESGFDWDAGINVRFPDFFNFGFDLVYFDGRMKDLIQWQLIDTIYMPQNITKSRNKGIEIGASLQLFKQMLDLSLNYTGLNARNLSDDPTVRNKYLPYRAESTLNSSLNFHYGPFSAGYDFRYAGKRFADEKNDIPVDSYNLSDVHFRLKLDFSGWQPMLNLQIRNIFNANYQIIADQPSPGREYRLNLGIAY